MTAVDKMRKIVVTGISGSGKTSLAATLSHWLGIPRIDMDALYHGPGWKRREEFEHDVRVLTEGTAWICDAHYHQIVGGILAERADAFIWLDLPRPTVMRRVIGRSLARVVLRRRLWNGNIETWRQLLLSSSHPVRWAWSHHAARRAEIAAYFDEHPDTRVIRLRTAAEATQWLRTMRPPALAPEGSAHM